MLQMQFGYDVTGNLLSVTENKQVSPGETVTENHLMAYDHLDRQISYSNFDGQVLANAYDRNGNKISYQHGGATAVTYGYNARNYLDQVCLDPPGCTQVTRYSYFPDGLKEQIRRANGTIADFEYDRTDRHSRIYDHRGGDLVAEQLYAYDANGNRLSMEERYAAIDGGLMAASSYSYDPANRLTRVAYPNGAELNYTYSPNGIATRLHLWPFRRSYGMCPSFPILYLLQIIADHLINLCIIAASLWIVVFVSYSILSLSTLAYSQTVFAGSSTHPFAWPSPGSRRDRP